MNYENYNLLLKAIIEYVEAIKNKNISEEDIRIFMKINDIIYILISKEYNTPELYKELEQISYGLREKYNKKLSQRIYVDFFNNFYGNEEELIEEINIGMVIEELNIKDIREKLEEIILKKSLCEIERNKVYISTNIIKELEKRYNTLPLIMGVHKTSTELNKIKIIRAHKVLIESELYSDNKLNNSEIKPAKPISWHCLVGNATHQIQLYE